MDAIIKQKRTVDELLKDVSERLARYRYDKRLNVEDMAKKAGISVPMIYKIEGGIIGNISLNKLIDLAYAIGLDIELKLKKI